MAPTGNKKQNTNGAAADRSAKDMLRVPAHLVRWAEALFFDGESSVFRIQGLPVSPPEAHLILSFHQPPATRTSKKAGSARTRGAPLNHNGNNIEARLWAAADELRANSKLKSSGYSVAVLGLVSLRYADHKFQALARELLVNLKAGKLVLDWGKRQQARAEVRVTIEKVLDLGLPRAYTPELFGEKTSVVFQHVYDAYYGAGRSLYAATA